MSSQEDHGLKSSIPIHFTFEITSSYTTTHMGRNAHTDKDLCCG